MVNGIRYSLASAVRPVAQAAGSEAER
jgi:hypothetical protein